MKDEDEDEEGAITSAAIWGLFGKNKADYMKNDVFSDDEDDMEMGVADVLKEEALRFVPFRLFSLMQHLGALWIADVLMFSSIARGGLPKKMKKR